MRLVVKTLAWWVVLAVGWTATLPVLAGQEVLAGIVGALVAAIVAAAAGRLVGGDWRPDHRWLLWTARLVPAVLADTVRLLLRAVPRLLRDRRWDGELRRARHVVGEPAPRASARRALGTLAMSAAPGSLVVDWPSARRLWSTRWSGMGAAWRAR
jgi:hypothetical protein